MNFRSFGKYLVILGIVIAAYGVFRVVSNRPVKFTPQEALPYTMGNAVENVNRGLENARRSFEVRDENQRRALARKAAAKPIGAGLIVAFVGGAMVKSARKQSPER